MKIKKERELNIVRIGSYLNYQNFFPNGKAEEERERESLELYDPLCFAELHSPGTRRQLPTAHRWTDGRVK